MDSEKCFALYFPVSLLEQKDEAYYLLQDIDANYSKLVQAILENIIEECTSIVNENRKNESSYSFKDFDWKLTAVKKQKES